MANLPYQFEPNVGQVADPSQQFIGQSGDATVLLSANTATWLLQSGTASAPAADDFNTTAPPPLPTTTELQMQFVGANPSAQAQGTGLLPGVSNYFIGDNPSQWRTDVPNYSGLVIQEVYPGIDLVYQDAAGGGMEYSWQVAPGADPGQIQLAFTGAQSITLDGQGNLLLQTAAGTVEQKAPVVYQMVNGIQENVAGHFVLEAGNRVGFAVGSYNASLPLVIDPSCFTSTYVSGSGTQYLPYGQPDGEASVAVDGSGNIIIVGTTTSASGLATSGAYQTAYGGDTDAFVTKINSSGSIVFTSYLGGAATDYGFGVAVDSSGNIYMTGMTYGKNFPVTSGAYMTTSPGGTSAAFITKLNSSGTSLDYSTYLYGSGGDRAYGIAVNSSGDAYVTGFTNSTNFPMVNAVQSTYGGGTDAFVTALNSSGSALDFSTYLGGSGQDVAYAVTLGTGGNFYITGQTQSSNFPTAAPAGYSPAQSSYHSVGGDTTDAFIAKLNYSGSSLSLVYSTYYGVGAEYGYAVAVNSSGDAYITGQTGDQSTLPLVDPLQSSLGGILDPPGIYGGSDAFIAKLNSTGSSFTFSSYLGGSGDDKAFGIAIDSSGNVYITGQTSSTDFPIVGGMQPTKAGTTVAPYDAFLAVLNSADTALLYSTYLGGSNDDYGYGVALDTAASPASVVIAGQTYSSDLPGAVNSYGGNGDAFVC